MSKPSVEMMSRAENGGNIAFLRAKNSDLTNPDLLNALEKYTIYGAVPGATYTLFQIAEGNANDFFWFVESYLQKNVNLKVWDKRSKVTLLTYDHAQFLTYIVFSMALTPNCHATLNALVYDKLKV
jgi:hypothetical protein